MKLKKLLSFTAAAVVALTALAGAMTVSADTVDSGTCGDLSWTLDSEGVLTFSGQGDMDSPNVDSGSLESNIGDYPNIYTYKEHKDAIKEVKIEEGATSIGFCAFYKFPNLETVILPSTITEFSGIKSLVNNEENSAAGAAPITHFAFYSYAFAECTSLKSLTLTDGIIAIGAYSFYKCTSLDNVIIPKSITNWDINTFSDCTSLKNVTLPEGLTTIGAYAFSGTAIRSIVIPSTISDWRTKKTEEEYATEYRSNGNCAFYGCNKLSNVTLSDGIEIIGDVMFPKCSSLKHLAIPASVTNISYAFSYCSGLEEVYIEEGAEMKIIGNDTVNKSFQNAFYNCENLKRLEIPAGIELDYNNQQWCTKCTSLTDLYIHSKDCDRYVSDGGGTPKIHCYFDSTTYDTLLKSYSSDRFMNLADEISVYKDTIQSRLNDAKSYDETKYTPESYGVLKALIEKAEKYGDDSNIMSMEQTASDIRAAIKALEKKPDEPVTDPTSDDKSDSTDNSNNTSDSSNNKPTPPEKTEPTTAKTPVQNNINKPANKVPSTPKVTAQKPAKVKSVKLTAKKKKLNVQWKKVSGATGYEVMYATNNKFTKNKKTVKVKKNKVTLKRLKSKKKYYVKVRAYKKANGDTNYGKWSKVVKKKAK